MGAIYHRKSKPGATLAFGGEERLQASASVSRPSRCGIDNLDPNESTER